MTRAQAEARAMVIFGHGPCFSAGLDLGEHRARQAEKVFHHSCAWHAVFTAIRRGHIPVVATLHGATVGGGLELAAACHIRLADTTVFFALNSYLLNFLGDEGQDLIRSAFGNNYKRLVELKTKYDQTNFFSVNQNIEPLSNSR